VLADTEDLHCAAFHAVAMTLGTTCTRADYYARFLGLPDRDCLAALCAQAGIRPEPARLDALVARKRAEFAALSQAATLYPGVADVLARLHEHFVLAVASGAFRDEIDAILERHRVRALFTAVVGADDVRAGKPAPDPFLGALAAINTNLGRAPGHPATGLHAPLTASECVVIEDSPRGIDAARAAGMRCIGVTTNHDAAALGQADAIIESVCHLRPEALLSCANE
jgi:beta-phosphoglucomutase-like phosphatase (HAD superfamily)